MPARHTHGGGFLPIPTSPPLSLGQALPVGAGGYLCDLCIGNDNTLAVRTDTFGAYLWNGVGGTSWTQLMSPTALPGPVDVNVLPILIAYSIAICYNTPSVIYMTMGQKVYKSTNKGATFTASTWTAPDSSDFFAFSSWVAYRLTAQRMAVDPNNSNKVYVGTNISGAFYSTDGTNFNAISGLPTGASPTSGYRFVVDPSDASGNTIIAAVPTTGNALLNIYRTTTGPAGTWVNITSSGSFPAAIPLSFAIDPVNGRFFCSDGANGWQYIPGTGWTNIISGSGSDHPSAFAIDPQDHTHVLCMSYVSRLAESHTGGNSGTWTTFSDGGIGVGSGLNVGFPGPVKWMSILNPFVGPGGDTSTLAWNTSSYTVYGTSSRNISYQTVTGVLSTSYTSNWIDRSQGIEQLVANGTVRPPGVNNVYLESWDTPFFIDPLPSGLTTFIPISALPATPAAWSQATPITGWSFDYLQSTPSFMIGTADNGYPGGSLNYFFAGISSDGGQNWTSFAGLPTGTSVNARNHGTLTASSTTNFLWATAGGGTVPAYTTNAGASWTDVPMPTGVTYASWFGASSKTQFRSCAADRVLSNTFYLLAHDLVVGGGLYQSTNSGATFNPTSLEGLGSPSANAISFNQVSFAVPFNGSTYSGSGNDVWLYTNDGQGLAYTVPQVWHYTKPSGSWVFTPITFLDVCTGFDLGCPAPGKTYPAIYAYGWSRPAISGSITITMGPTGHLSVPTGITYKIGAWAQVYSSGSNNAWGQVTAFDPVAGTVDLNVTLVNGTISSQSGCVLICFGLWQSIDTAATWTQLTQYINNWLNLGNITADPDVYGRVFISHGGSGWAYYQS